MLLCAVTIAVNAPDALVDIAMGTVAIVVVPHFTVIVSVGVKPVPFMVVAKPVLGDSIIFGVTGTDAVTV